MRVARSQRCHVSLEAISEPAAPAPVTPVAFDPEQFADFLDQQPQPLAGVSLSKLFRAVWFDGRSVHQVRGDFGLTAAEARLVWAKFRLARKDFQNGRRR
jgi:hypothetical protein